MKFSKVICLGGALLLSLFSESLPAQVFVSYLGIPSTGEVGGHVSEYTMAGQPINPLLISSSYGVETAGLALSGNNLFLAGSIGQIGKFTTTGTAVDPKFIQFNAGVQTIALAGDYLYVVTGGNVALCSVATGAILNPSLLHVRAKDKHWTSIAAAGSNLYVASFNESSQCYDLTKYVIAGLNISSTAVIAKGSQEILSGVTAMTADDQNLYVAYDAEKIGCWPVDGTHPNPYLIEIHDNSNPLVEVPYALAISGNSLYVANNQGPNTLSVFHKDGTSGKALVTGLKGIEGVVVLAQRHK